MTDSRLTESVCEIVDNVDNGRKTLDTIYWRSSRDKKWRASNILFEGISN